MSKNNFIKYLVYDPAVIVLSFVSYTYRNKRQEGVQETDQEFMA